MEPKICKCKIGIGVSAGGSWANWLTISSHALPLRSSNTQRWKNHRELFLYSCGLVFSTVHTCGVVLRDVQGRMTTCFGVHHHKKHLWFQWMQISQNITYALCKLHSRSQLLHTLIGSLTRGMHALSCMTLMPDFNVHLLQYYNQNLSMGGPEYPPHCTWMQL